MPTERDIQYEQEISKQLRRFNRILNLLYKKTESWSEMDYLAAERALQILIEAMIGFSRYCLESCFGIRVSKSREAVDELKNLNVFSEVEHKQFVKLIGFRNILVHDYLSIDEDIVKAIVKKQEYYLIKEFFDQLLKKITGV